MALDPVKNFAISRVATAPSPAASGTTLVVEAGDGVLFPDPSSSGEYNVVIYPNGEQPSSTNAEIVRVTARSSDTMTIEREAESTDARTIVEGDVVMLGITAKVVEDLDDIATVAAGIATDFNGGWIDADETWTYASADDPTYTFTVAADVTGKYSAGMRIKLTQTTVKYFIITAVSSYSGGNTTITVYGGTDYDLADAAISSNYYSTQKAPQGFPLDPSKWTVVKLDTTRRQQSNPTNFAWYNLGTTNSQISAPIGVWKVRYVAYVGASGSTSATDIEIRVTLSTANNSESNKLSSMASYLRNIPATAAGAAYQVLFEKEGLITATSKTTYYLNGRHYTGAGTTTDLSFFGNDITTEISLTCAYL